MEDAEEDLAMAVVVDTAVAAATNANENDVERMVYAVTTEGIAEILHRATRQKPHLRTTWVEVSRMYKHDSVG